MYMAVVRTQHYRGGADVFTGLIVRKTKGELRDRVNDVISGRDQSLVQWRLHDATGSFDSFGERAYELPMPNSNHWAWVDIDF